MAPGALFVAAASTYAFACLLYLGLLGRASPALGRAANGLLIVAAILHGVILGRGILGHDERLEGIHDALSAASLIIVFSFLAAQIRSRVTVLGAFVTPVALLFFLGAGIGRTVEPVPSDVRSVLAPLHVAVNLGGIAAFALAFAAAIGYVLQDRFLRRKQLGGLFQRLPSLDVLDRFGLRSIIVGFPLLTIGVVTGALWAHRTETSDLLSLPQLLGLLTWIVFASVLLLRVMVGWRGRKAAFGTIFGFLCAVGVIALYVVRAGGAA